MEADGETDCVAGLKVRQVGGDAGGGNAVGGQAGMAGERGAVPVDGNLFANTAQVRESDAEAGLGEEVFAVPGFFVLWEGKGAGEFQRGFVNDDFVWSAPEDFGFQGARNIQVFGKDVERFPDFADLGFFLVVFVGDGGDLFFEGDFKVGTSDGLGVAPFVLDFADGVLGVAGTFGDDSAHHGNGDEQDKDEQAYQDDFDRQGVALQECRADVALGGGVLGLCFHHD